ncbi:MAG: DNA gyrase subunit A [Candidatus Atribacteria bacterium]|nr:DNA gyrase subunit A [Candidatus Atribacteria bacterium]MCD6350129.1 DNA gyrase subunit A [Candidatus Atribacteria bacterium]
MSEVINNRGERIVTVDIKDEMREAYLSYAMSVIVGRALPDVRDGLKPVQRRVLYSMYEMGLRSTQAYRKSARVVGDVLGKYHPHGDMAVYDALVRMAQDFTFRYPLIDGHGNFGSVDGDPPAAMRYTEVRMAPIAEEMLRDIEKETVDFMPNFDESAQEPVVLPASFPQLLANGASGIAVGMATNIPPHNLSELIDGALLLIDRPESSWKELLKVIPGPDFPTYGKIIGKKGIKDYFRTGRGRLVIRGEAEVEEIGKGKKAIVIKELPYQVNKASLVEHIARLVQEKKLNDISEVRDESDREGIRVVLELKKGANPQFILNYLYKHTALQVSFGVILLALVNGRPEVMGMVDALRHFIEHRKEVVLRRSTFELRRAEERVHLLEGFLKALDMIDMVIETIRSSSKVEEARGRLMARFDFTEKQAQAILEMRLQRLVALEREKLQREYEELLQKIQELQKILSDQRTLFEVIKKELREIKEKFGDPRRTRIVEEEETIEEIDLVPEEDIVITLTRDGYIKRVALDAYRRQGRGGKGVSAINIKEEDIVSQVAVSTTLHRVLFFTSKGRSFQLLAYQLPEASRQAKSTHLVNLLPLEEGERVFSFLTLKDFGVARYLFMVTNRGKVKRLDLLELVSITRRGIRVIKLGEDEELSRVFLTSGNEEIFVVSAGGYAIRFAEEEVRPMGRSASGVRGINLRDGDEVVGACPLSGARFVLVVSEKGNGKKLDLSDFPCHHRGGKGLRIMKISQRTGKVVDILPICEEGDVLVSTQKGMLIRINSLEIPVQGRITQGVRLIKLDRGDSISSLALVEKE